MDQCNAAVKAGGGNTYWSRMVLEDIGVKDEKLAMVAVEQTIQTNQDLRQNQDAGEKEMQLGSGFARTMLGAKEQFAWQRDCNFKFSKMLDDGFNRSEVYMKPQSESDSMVDHDELALC